MSKCILGIDVGTTNVKSLIQERFEYPTFFPEAGWAEQDAEQWWEATVETISQITTNPQINKYEIAAIGVSSQAPTVLPLDIKGNPLRNALIWMDRRSKKECDFLRH